MARTEGDDVLEQALLRAGGDVAIVAQPTPLQLRTAATALWAVARRLPVSRRRTAAVTLAEFVDEYVDAGARLPNRDRDHGLHVAKDALRTHLVVLGLARDRAVRLCELVEDRRSRMYAMCPQPRSAATPRLRAPPALAARVRSPPPARCVPRTSIQ